MNFVSFDLAKKLKEKGFKTENTDWYYLDGDLVQVKKYINISPYEYAPTISQVLKWLRKEKCLHIEIVHIFSEETLWDFEVAHIGSYERWWSNRELFNTYDKAALAGVNYCLENLI